VLVEKWRRMIVPLSVLVIVATLNEEEGIGPTLAELREVSEDPMFLVVDGNSTDRTVEIAKEMGTEVLFQEETVRGTLLAHA
jgi:glycosyltransferase involved in cell wall biosynthesis